MTKKEIIRKSLGFSLFIYFFALILIFFSLPFLISTMIKNHINLDEFLMGIVICSPIFYCVVFVISYLIFKKDKDKLEKNRFDKICIFLGKYILLIIITFIIFCFLAFFGFFFSLSNVSLKGFFVCSDGPFSEVIKSNGNFEITNRGVCANNYTCEKFKGFAECENLDENKYYSRKVVNGANKNNFNFFIDKNYDTFFTKDNNIAILKSDYSKDNLFLIVKNVDLETFQYLGGKYSKDKNHVYYKSEIIPADPETFIYEKRTGKVTGRGKDKNGIWIKGVLQK